jgi:protein-disulfide isomerase
MKKSVKVLLLGLIVGTMAAGSYVAMASMGEKSQPAPAAPKITDEQKKMLAELDKKKLPENELVKFYAPKADDLVIFGVQPSQAKVVIIEYGDFTCPHCADFYLKTMVKIKEKYIDEQKQKISIIHRSLPGSGQSFRAMQLLECKTLSNDKKMRLIKTLYSTNMDWAFGGGDYSAKLEKIFSVYGYTAQECKTCFDDESLQQKILQNRINLIEKGGLRFTPMIVVNGKPLPDPTYSTVENAINKALK